MNLNMSTNQLSSLSEVLEIIGAADIPFWGMSIDEDMAIYLVNSILELKPKVIVELGSGVSTLFIGSCLRHLGQGKLISFEHDSVYFNKTSEQLKKFGLEDWVDLQLRPLTAVEITDQLWQWYNLNNFTVNESIDLLFVDGPPGTVQRFSRYPALPLLSSFLNKNSVVLLDDGQRFEEREVARRWAMAYGLNFKYLNNEHETIVFRKTSRNKWSDVNKTSLKVVNTYRQSILSLKSVVRKLIKRK